MTYNTPKDYAEVEKTIKALEANNMIAVFAKDRSDAVSKVLEMIDAGSSVMTMTSVTLDELGIAKEINESGKFNSVREKFSKMDPKTQGTEMRAMAAAPDVTVGSVHAVTEDGKVIIASNTGSQLPAYVYGAGKVVWVVGTQKIVKDLDDGMKRLYEYTLPLESERAHKAYGVEASFVSKVLIVNKEVTPGRINIVFVPENIGF